MVPKAAGDGSYAFPAPTVTTGSGLQDFAKISSGDALVALSQMAAAYTTAESRIDPRLPLVDTAVSELGSAAEGLNKLVEAQGAAAVTCGRANTSPPSATTVPGTTWYCQARTADPIKAGTVTVVAARRRGHPVRRARTTRPSARTRPRTSPSPAASPSPTSRSPSRSPAPAATSPSPPSDGCAPRRSWPRAFRPAGRLRDTVPAYDATTRALTFPVTTDVDPAAKALPYAFGDLFRTKAHLRSIETPRS